MIFWTLVISLVGGHIVSIEAEKLSFHFAWLVNSIDIVYIVAVVLHEMDFGSVYLA